MQRCLDLILLAVLLVACAPGPGQTAPPPSEEPPAASPPVRGDGREPSPQPSPVEPQPGAVDARPVAFESAEPGTDERHLTITWWSGVEPCHVLDRVEVTQAAESVTVTLFEGGDPAQPDAVCIQIAVLKSVTVTLSEPLGGRRVIDGAA